MICLNYRIKCGYTIHRICGVTFFTYALPSTNEYGVEGMRRAFSSRSAAISAYLQSAYFRRQRVPLAG